MKHLIRKISSEPSDLIGKIVIGDVNVSVACKNDVVVGLVNGYKVVDAGLYDNFIDKISPILSSIIAKIYRDRWGDSNSKLTIYKEDWDTKGLYPSVNLLEKILYNLNKHLDKETVQVIEKPSGYSPENLEEKDTSSIDINYQSLSSNITLYKQQLEMLGSYIDRIFNLSEVLTRTKLVSSMHGSEIAQMVIDSARNSVSILRPSVGDLEHWVSLSLKTASKLTYRLDRNLIGVSNDSLYLCSVLIPEITENYIKIKDFCMKLSKAIAPLVNIDDIFNNFVKFSTSLFLPMNRVEDLKESYEVLIEFLSSVHTIEARIIDPLAFLKIKNSYKK